MKEKDAKARSNQEDMRNYDVNDLRDEEDTRFHYALKEMLTVQGICFTGLIVILLLAYGLCPKDISELTYIAGFPMWFAVSAIASFLVVLVVIVYCLKFSKDMSLDAKDEEGRIE